MLIKTKEPSVLLRRVLVVATAVAVTCLVLAAALGPIGPRGHSALSRLEMQVIVGGETKSCCDDCHTLSRTFLECDHFNTWGEPPVPTDCNTSGCLNNVLLTKSCSHSQGPGAEGCDTDQDTSQPLYIQYQYVPANDPCDVNAPHLDETCTLKAGQTGNWFIWIKVWHGCDTGPDKECEDDYWWGACWADSCTMVDLDYRSRRGNWYICGC